MPFCLVKELSTKIKQMIKSGELNIDKLTEMSSLERRQYFTDILGERNAKEVNSLFESKLLLKNQRLGLVNWAKQITGIKEATKVDLISKIGRMDKILTPENEQAFLQDLASKRLGIDITIDEATKISELSNKVKELENYTDDTERIKFGRAKIELTDYVNDLGGTKADLFTNIAGIPRSIMASLDLSAPLNQGWGMLGRKQFYTAFRDMFKFAKSEENLKNLQADILTRPNYKLARKAGLRLTDLSDKLEMREEQFMTTLLDKVPGVSASQRAYTGFLNKLRMDVFDDLIKKAEVAGEDVGIGSKSAEDIAKNVNNFTGGARVGKAEQAVPILNATFFSPRKIASTINILNPLNYIDQRISKTARLAATRNLIGSFAISSGFIGLANLLGSDKPETDPTSSDFGKIKSGDTRIDVSGGNATYLNILSRLITKRIKGSSGASKELGTGIGQTSGADLISQFLRYKLSPNASLLVDSITGANAIGEKKTIPQSVIDRFRPMFLNSIVELLKSDTNGKFAFALGALFGGGLNTYTQSTDWSENTSKELNQFKQKVGDEKFQEANDDYNQQYNDWLKQRKTEQSYKDLPDEVKTKEITKKKAEIKQYVFKQYDFKPTN